MVNSPSFPTVQSGSAPVEPIAKFGVVSKTFVFPATDFEPVVRYATRVCASLLWKAAKFIALDGNLKRVKFGTPKGDNLRRLENGYDSFVEFMVPLIPRRINLTKRKSGQIATVVIGF